MAISLQVISLQPKFRELRNKSYFTPYKSDFAPYRSDFAPKHNLVWNVYMLTSIEMETTSNMRTFKPRPTCELLLIQTCFFGTAVHDSRSANPHNRLHLFCIVYIVLICLLFSLHHNRFTKASSPITFYRWKGHLSEERATKEKSTTRSNSSAGPWTKRENYWRLSTFLPGEIHRRSG